MGKVDREVESIAVERLETRPLVAVTHLDWQFDTQVTLERRLFDNARRLQQEDERAGTAIHDRNLGPRHIDVQIIDSEACECRHQMLDGRDRCAVFLKRR